MGLKDKVAIVTGGSQGIEDVANACLFLASDQASYINGHTLRVDGGVFSKMARPLLFD